MLVSIVFLTVRSQARPRVAKVHRLRNEEANRLQLQISQENEEEYNDTRRWTCYEAALLMKNEIRKDRKHPLTTPEYASVRQSTVSSSKRSP